MDLKKILGDSYNPEMSLKDIEKALEGVDMVESSALDGKVDKSKLDKALSEVSKLNKELRAKKSDEELKEDEFNSLKEQLLALQKEKTVAENKSKFITLGLSEKMSAKTAEALVDGDFDTVFTSLAKFKESVEKSVKAETVKSTERPDSGSEPGGRVVKKGEFANMSLAEIEAMAKENPEIMTQYQSN